MKSKSSVISCRYIIGFGAGITYIFVSYEVLFLRSSREVDFKTYIFTIGNKLDRFHDEVSDPDSANETDPTGSQYKWKGTLMNQKYAIQNISYLPVR
jgi:hypothetical protein